ncbi:ARM repeat-containing protein [Serendipita vermifera]|nr:ARM repeat-containing protein [Serendipita vermifera]
MIVNLAAHEKARTLVCDSIPQLIELLDHNNLEMRSSVISTLTKLCDHKELRKPISEAIPNFLKLLSDPSISSNAALALAKFVEHDEFRGLIHNVIPQVVALSEAAKISPSVYDSLSTKLAAYQRQPPTGRQPSKDALIKLANSPIFLQSIAFNVPKLTQMLESSGPFTRRTALVTITDLAKHSEIRVAIHDILPRIIGLLSAQNKETQAIAAHVFSALCQYEDLQGVIGEALSPLSALIKVQQGNSTSAAAVSALTKLYGYVATFRGSISDLIPQVIDLLHSRDRETLVASISSLAQLGVLAESSQLVRSSIPQLIDLLRYPNPSVQSTVVSTFAKLADHSVFQDDIRHAIPHLTKMLKSPDNPVRYSVISAIGRMAEHAEFRELIVDIIPHITERLRSIGNDPSESAVVSTLNSFAKHVEFQDAIRAIIPSLIKWLKFSEPHIRSASANALAQLVEHGEQGT